MPIFLSLIVPDIENIPVVKYVAVAGKNITLDCPGVNERSLVETLVWRTSHTIAEYVNGLPLVSNQRVSVRELLIVFIMSVVLGYGRWPERMSCRLKCNDAAGIGTKSNGSSHLKLIMEIR